MTVKQYLEPAYSLILKFSAEGSRLSDGIDEVARIVGRHRTNVYRWMLPADRGGTGGMIPVQAQRKLFEYAKKKRLNVDATDFFDARAA